ncbi:MAG: YlxR family protein [Lachnospiraceae bacterium]|nr:YlxR family protein [Lachnospiraceae bacterium]
METVEHRDKRIPERTCIGCNGKRPKRELLRVSRHKDGTVNVDMHGTGNGRGAYICRNLSCFDAAVKRKGFARTFKAAMPDEVTDALREDFERALNS